MFQWMTLTFSTPTSVLLFKPPIFYLFFFLVWAEKKNPQKKCKWNKSNSNHSLKENKTFFFFLTSMSSLHYAKTKMQFWRQNNIILTTCYSEFHYSVSQSVRVIGKAAFCQNISRDLHVIFIAASAPKSLRGLKLSELDCVSGKTLRCFLHVSSSSASRNLTGYAWKVGSKQGLGSDFEHSDKV